MNKKKCKQCGYYLPITMFHDKSNICHVCRNKAISEYMKIIMKGSKEYDSKKHSN